MRCKCAHSSEADVRDATDDPQDGDEHPSNTGGDEMPPGRSENDPWEDNSIAPEIWFCPKCRAKNFHYYDSCYWCTLYELQSRGAERIALGDFSSSMEFEASLAPSSSPSAVAANASSSGACGSNEMPPHLMEAAASAAWGSAADAAHSLPDDVALPNKKYRIIEAFLELYNSCLNAA